MSSYLDLRPEPGSILESFEGSVDRVLEYAFRMGHTPIVTTSSVFISLSTTGVPVQNQHVGYLTKHEHHAQVAIIIAAVDRLPDPQQAVIYGWHDKGTRKDCIKILMKHINMVNTLPREIHEMLIMDWLTPTNRKIGRHLKRTVDRLVDEGKLEKKLSSNQISLGRGKIFKQLNEFDLRAKENLHIYWAKNGK